jgi:hypothetical protein
MSINKRTGRSGAVTWVVRFRDPVPRQRTFKRKTDAEQFERRILREMDTGEYVHPSLKMITFEEWHDLWWPTVETSNRAPGTITSYESSLRIQVLPYLGEYPLQDLRRIHLQQWLGILRKAGYSNSPRAPARPAEP